MTSLRERQRTATRAAIVTAFLDLSHETADTVSMPAVANAAGVSVRTLYRYFPTRSALQLAAANYYDDRVRQRIDGGITVDNFVAYLTELWLDFEDELPAVVAQHATPAGRELRATRLPGSRATVRRALQAAGAIEDPAIDGAVEGRAVEDGAVEDGAVDGMVDLVIALTSSSMFLELVDRMGHEPSEAVAMVAKTVRLLLAEAAEQRSPNLDSPNPNSRKSRR